MNTHQHVIDIAPQTLTLENVSNSRNLISRILIYVELGLTVCQLVVAVVFLSFSKHEKNSLFGWIVVYASGCGANLATLYVSWYYRNRNRQGPLPASVSYLSNTRNSEGNSQPIRRGPQVVRAPNSRFKEAVEYFKFALCCFFAVWFVVGNGWIFEGHTSPTEDPHLYRFCILFLTYSCIGYLIPIIIGATMCCCAPCMIAIMVFREGNNQNRGGATSELNNSLPTYKFKIKKVSNASGRENNSSAVEGGVVAAGTEKERAISGEDAVCCICLAKYANNDELRELPCVHIFHKDCVDKWLKIKASCPLCKGRVQNSTLSSVPEASAP